MRKNAARHEPRRCSPCSQDGNRQQGCGEGKRLVGRLGIGFRKPLAGSALQRAHARQKPGFYAIAIVSLALGIGANTAIFTLVNDLLFKSLPVRDPQQLVSFGKAFGGGEVDGIEGGPLDIFTYDFYQRLSMSRRGPHPLHGHLCLRQLLELVSVRIGSGGNGAATQAAGQLVTRNFLVCSKPNLCWAEPSTPGDATAPGSDPVAVISYRYWQQMFAGDPAIIGRTITINGTLFTVIGVMPPKFEGVAVDTSPWICGCRSPCSRR